MSKPIIGITRDSDGTTESLLRNTSYAFYARSVEAAGGEVLPILFSDDLTRIPGILEKADGLLFSGGDDLDPALYGQSWHPKAKAVDPRRQRFELALIEAAEKVAKPILGICLGCQLMNVHRGGSLIQFLPDLPGTLEHRKINDVVLRHDVSLDVDTILGKAIGKPLVNVNTYHKQAIDRVGSGLRVTARAPDGVVEGIEDESRPLFVGVQWHPERNSNEPEHDAIFRMLVSACTR